MPSAIKLLQPRGCPSGHTTLGRTLLGKGRFREKYPAWAYIYIHTYLGKTSTCSFNSLGLHFLLCSMGIIILTHFSRSFKNKWASLVNSNSTCNASQGKQAQCLLCRHERPTDHIYHQTQSAPLSPPRTQACSINERWMAPDIPIKVRQSHQNMAKWQPEGCVWKRTKLNLYGLQ